MLNPLRVSMPAVTVFIMPTCNKSSPVETFSQWDEIETLYKHTRGDPNNGLQVWVFGMVEMSTNIMINIQCETVLHVPIHCLLSFNVIVIMSGLKVYSGGSSAYVNSNALRYKQFTVI